MGGRLSQAQVADYWRDGFVCVRGLFAAEEIAPWLARTRALASGEAPPPPGMQMMRDVMVAKKAVAMPSREHEIGKINFFENDPVLMGYARHPHLLDCVESLLGERLLFGRHAALPSLLLHGSGTNRSQGFRRAISAHYARAGCDDLWDGQDRLANRPWLPVRGAAPSS
jgi:hypothetical protein